MGRLTKGGWRPGRGRGGSTSQGRFERMVCRRRRGRRWCLSFFLILDIFNGRRGRLCFVDEDGIAAGGNLRLRS